MTFESETNSSAHIASQIDVVRPRKKWRTPLVLLETPVEDDTNTLYYTGSDAHLSTFSANS